MALNLLAPAVKAASSFVGGKKSEKVAPKQPKVQKPTQSSEKVKSKPKSSDKPSEPTKAPRVTRVSGPTSPLFSKVGDKGVDKALQNISKSLGNIKATLASTDKFQKQVSKAKKDAVKKSLRKKKEDKQESNVMAGIISAAKGLVKQPADLIKRFLTNVLLGALAGILVAKSEEIIEGIQKVVDKIKEVFDLLNKYVFTPILTMVKAIVGPITEEVAKFVGVDEIEAAENSILENISAIEKETGILGGVVDGIKKTIKGINDMLPTTSRATPSTSTTTTTTGGVTPPAARPSRGSTSSPGSSGTTPSGTTPPGGRTSDTSTPGGGSGGGQWQPILELIAKHEAVGGSYDSIYPSTTKPGLSNMTIAEADAWQASTASQRGSAAAGRYQFMYIKDQAAAAGIGPNEKFSPANQDKMAVALITKKRGVTWSMVKNNPNEAMIRLGMEWASLPMPVAMQGASRYVQAGQSYYAGDGLNRAGASVEEVRSALGAAQVTPPAERAAVKPQVQPQTPIMGEAYKTGLKTGSSQYIGGSSDYHIDTKFPASLSPDKAVAMVDQMSRAYAEQGREIEFSNSAVAGLVYDHNASYATKLALLQRVFNAHAPRGGWRSMDYYIPLKSDSKGRFGASAEGAEIVTPTIPGGKIEYHEGGRYGAFVVVVDENGNVISKTGHGDIRGSRSGTVIDIPRGTNNQSGSIDRRATYDKRGRRILVAPGGGANRMMSGPRASSGGGAALVASGSGNQDYGQQSLINRLWKQA